jgi:hypothetical protein
VKEADAVLICLSRTSVSKSAICRRRYVTFSITPIISARAPSSFRSRLEDCPVPNRLSRFHYADLFSDRGYESLLRSLTSTSPESTRTALLPSTVHHVRIWPRISLQRSSSAPAPASTTPPPRQTEQPPPGMAHIPAGRFLMGRNGSGDPESEPAHELEVRGSTSTASLSRSVNSAGFSQ